MNRWEHFAAMVFYGTVNAFYTTVNTVLEATLVALEKHNMDERIRELTEDEYRKPV